MHIDIDIEMEYRVEAIKTAPSGMCYLIPTYFGRTASWPACLDRLEVTFSFVSTFTPQFYIILYFEVYISERKLLVA